jgi:hypothetical protein
MVEFSQEEIWQQIDSAAYLFLGRLFEPRDNQLTIFLEEAVANKAKKAPRIFTGGVDLGEATPIEHTPECRVFSLSWTSYVTYCVTEEMVGSCGEDKDDVHTGQLLRQCSESNFLSFLAKETGAHFAPYQHYKICCQNHNIDIAATASPTLGVLSPTEAKLSPHTLIQ